MRAAGVCAVDAAVDSMVLISSQAFNADSKFPASGSDVKVVWAFRWLWWFRALGLSHVQIAKTVAGPAAVLRHSVEDNLRPTV